MRAEYDGTKRRRGSNVHRVADIRGHLWAAHVTAVHEQARRYGCVWAEKVQEVTRDAVERTFVDQGYTGAQAASAAEAHPR
jgi:hypothetical protein